MNRLAAVGVIASVLVACGGGSSSSSSTATTESSASSSSSGGASSTSVRATGACYIASMGACQWFYDDDPDHTPEGCRELEGTFGSDCPADGRVGDCMEASHLASRFYAGGAFAADAAAAQSACESSGGTFVP